MKKKFRVLLPIEVGGEVYAFDSVVELDVEVAKEYSHALIAVEEAEEKEETK